MKMFEILVVQPDDPIEKDILLLGLEDCRLIINGPEAIHKLEGLPIKRAYFTASVVWEGLDRDLFYYIESTLVRYSIPLSQGLRFVP